MSHERVRNHSLGHLWHINDIDTFWVYSRCTQPEAIKPEIAMHRQADQCEMVRFTQVDGNIYVSQIKGSTIC